MDKVIDYVKGWYFSGKLPSMPITETVLLVCLIVFFGNIKWDKKYPFKLILHYVLILIPLIIGKAYTHNTNFNVMIVYTLVMAAYAFIRGRKNLVKTSICFLTYWTAYFVSSLFAKSVVALFYVIFLNSQTPDVAMYVGLAVIQPLIFISAIVLMKKFPVDGHTDGGAKLTMTHVVPIAIVAVFAVVIRLLTDGIKEDRYSFISLNEQNACVFIFFAGLFILLVDAACYLFCYIRSKELLKEERLHRDLEKLKSSYENSEERKLLESNMEEIRTIRHDIKNQLAYIYLVLSQKEYGQLEDYFHQLYKNVELPLEFLDCDNATVRNLLSLEQYKAKQNDCKLDVDLSIPEFLEIHDVDLNALLINLIDNAIEAVVEDELREAVIDVKIAYEKQCLYVKVRNPIADESKTEERKSLRTRKDNANLHGRGVKIVKKIVEKYNGKFQYAVDDCAFTAEAFLII